MKDIKKIMLISFLVLFIVVSLIAVMPDKVANHDLGVMAAELKISESVDGAMTNTSYVNSDGVLTDAIDMGYATVQRTRNTDGKIIKELYFEADGNPVKRYNEYYGIAYEYEDNMVKITYLNADGVHPITLTTGYSIIVRTLNDAGKAVDEHYYNSKMQPASCNGYYGLYRGYNSDGQNIQEVYLDRNGQIVYCASGYAIKMYDRDSSDLVAAEYYYDRQKKPTTSTLGQYGEKYQRNENGQITQIIYLGVDGNPAPTQAGYTMLRRSYYRDGTAKTDMYFDRKGNSIALSKGQYGIRRSGKINLLLDKNGHIMLCVDNILNSFPFMVIAFGIIACALALILPRKSSIILTTIYIIFIFYETLMFREVGDSRTNFVLFSYADKFFKDQSIRVGVINNIWLFIPFGTGLYRNIQKKWVLLIPFLLSEAIETTQYIMGLGIAEFDDIFGNTVGGWVGIAVAYAVIKWKEKS